MRLIARWITENLRLEWLNWIFVSIYCSMSCCDAAAAAASFTKVFVFATAVVFTRMNNSIFNASTLKFEVRSKKYVDCWCILSFLFFFLFSSLHFFSLCFLFHFILHVDVDSFFFSFFSRSLCLFFPTICFPLCFYFSYLFHIFHMDWCNCNFLQVCTYINFFVFFPEQPSTTTTWNRNRESKLQSLRMLNIVMRKIVQWNSRPSICLVVFATNI